MSRKLCVIALALLAVTGRVTALAGEDANLTSLLSLLKAERYEECIKLERSTPYNGPRNAQLTYVAGICALRANRPYAARSAISRLLQDAPQYPGAWFAKAQADYLLHDRAALNESSVALASAKLPQELKQPARDWLARLHAAEHESVVTANAEIGLGYSSNANAGTTESDYLGQSLPTFVQRKSSEFAETTASAIAAKNLGTFERIFGAIRVTRRDNPSASFVNQTIVSVAAGYQRPLGNWAVTSVFRAFDERVAGAKQRQFGSLEASATRRVSDDWEASGAIRVGRLNYRIVSRPDLDVWRIQWSADASRLVGRLRRNRVGFGILGGGDEEVIFRSSYGNSRLGVRTFFDVSIGEHVQVTGEAAFSLTSFDVHGGFAGITRLDKQNILATTLTWKSNRTSRWSIEARVAHRELDSNVTVFGFNQNQAALYLIYRDR